MEPTLSTRTRIIDGGISVDAILILRIWMADAYRRYGSRRERWTVNRQDTVPLVSMRSRQKKTAAKKKGGGKVVVVMGH